MITMVIIAVVMAETAIVVRQVYESWSYFFIVTSLLIIISTFAFGAFEFSNPDKAGHSEKFQITKVSRKIINGSDYYKLSLKDHKPIEFEVPYEKGQQKKLSSKKIAPESTLDLKYTETKKSSMRSTVTIKAYSGVKSISPWVPFKVKRSTEMQYKAKVYTTDIVWYILNQQTESQQATQWEVMN